MPESSAYLASHGCRCCLPPASFGPRSRQSLGSSPIPRRCKHWQDMRFGMFIHWGPVSLTGRRSAGRGRETPVEVYDNLYKKFNPTKFDADAVGRDRQGRRHEVHRAYDEAPRRLLPVGHEVHGLQHHEQPVQTGRGERAVGRLQETRHRLRDATTRSAIGITRISR